MRSHPRRAVLALIALAGCGRAEPPADPAALVPARARVGEAWVALLVPASARVTASGGGRAVVHFAPGSRADPTLSLSAGPGAPAAAGCCR